ncbi:MAG: alpha/beta fold hydrolase [Thermoanaerobaculia bacterium]
MTRRATVAVMAVFLSLVALASLLLGAFLADPIGLVRVLDEARLRRSGMHVETFRALDGTRLSALVAGPLSAERPVVLLHGLGADALYWTRTMLSLRHEGKTVLALDAPGSGKSATPASPEGLSLPARVAAVEALSSALRLDRFDLVGHSLGGATAGLFALAHPEQVGRLVLVDAAGFTAPSGADLERFLALTRPRDRHGARQLLDLLFFAKPFPARGAVADALARRFLAPNVQTTIARAGRADVLLGREEALPAGTALIWGEKEALFPVADAETAARKLRGGTLTVVPGAGHDVPIEKPAEFVRVLLDTLSRS